MSQVYRFSGHSERNPTFYANLGYWPGDRLGNRYTEIDWQQFEREMNTHGYYL
jgi:hypothetical protein